jgi:hypothetical protein
MMATLRRSVLILAALIGLWATANAQDDAGPLDGLPTLFSVKVSGGYGLGRSRQLYGYNGASQVWWSTGEGTKLNLALDLPIIPVDVVDSFGGPRGLVPVVGLELEAATGYHISNGGTTNELVGTNFQTTTRATTYVPVTLGLNARSSFGAGLPSVYIGAGGGVYLIGIYEERVTTGTTGFTRKMHPPLPFGLYGAIGMELPILYDPDAGNSMIDIFTELRVTEMSNYVYDYDVVTENGVERREPVTDPQQPYPRTAQRSASNVSLSLGIKYNLF